MATVAQLDVSIGVEDKFSQGLSSASSKFSSFGADLTRLGAGLTASLTLPLLGIGASIIKIGSEFDDAFDTIAIATGATGNALRSLEQNFRNVVANVPTSFAAASEAMGTLAARTGLTGKALEELTKVELELSRMTKTELAGQIASTTRLFADWSVATDQQTETLDKLFRAFQAGGGSVQSLTEKLVQFGAPLRQMGFDLDESIALIAKFQKEGVNMELVLGSLRIALTRMAKEGIKDPIQALEVFIQRIKDAGSAGQANAISMEIFGARAGPDMAAAIREGRFAIEEMLAKIKDGKSTIMGTAESTKDFGERFVELKNKVTLALEPLGERFFAAVNNLVPVIVNLVGKLATLVEWFSKLPQPIQTFIIALGGIAVAAGPVMIAIGQVGGAINSLISISGSAIPAIARFSGALGGLGAAAGLVGVAVGGAFIAAEMQWSAAQKRFIASTNQMKTEVNRFGQEIKRLGDADIKTAIQSPGKLINGMVVDLKTGLVEGAKVAKTGATAIGAGIPKGFGDGVKSGGGAARAVVKDTFKTFRDAMADSIEDMNKLFDDGGKSVHTYLMNFGKIPAPVYEVVNALEELIVAEKELAGVAESANEVIKNTEPYTRLAGAVQVLQSQFEKLSQQLPRAWNTIIDGFVKGGTAASVKVKGFAVDIINVFDTLPGKWGQSLNRALDEVNKWINFIDSAFKLIQRMVGDEQTGIAGIISSVFRSTAKAVEDSGHSIGGSLANVASSAGAGLDDLTSKLQESGEEAIKTSNKWVTAVAGVVAGIAIFAGSRGQGLAKGIIGGAFAGFTAGAAIGSIIPGIGTLIGGGIGALIGGIAGIFGSGKTQQQKDAERDAMENAKMSMQQTAQNIVNSALEGFSKGLEFLEKLDEFTAPRKAKFKEFFKTFTKLMDYFVELSKSWSTTSMAQVKAVGEAMVPIAQGIASLPAAFDAINGHFGVAQSAIDQFFNDFDRIVTGFFTRVEAWAVGRAKHARKIATNIAPAIDLLGPLLEAIKNMSSLSRPPDEAFDIIENVLETIVMRTAALSEKFDKALLKVMQNFADKSGGALQLWSEAVGSIKAMVDLKMPTEQDFANVFTGIERVISGMTDVASRLTTEGLGRAEGMAQASLTLFASLKAGVEALSALKDFAGVLPEVFDKFFDDFNHAIELVESMATRAITFDNASKMFKDYISSGAAHLATAFQMLAQIMNAAGSFFPNGTPVTTTAVPALASGGDIASSGLAYLHAGERVVPATVVNQGGVQGTAPATELHVHVHAANIVTEAGIVDVIAKAIQQGEKMGKFSKGLLGGGTLQFAR